MAFFALAAGHGASDPGAVNGTRKEKDDNLKISLAVGNELIRRGHKVVQYRINDSACPAAACRSWLEKQKADFGLAFHRNSYSSSSATGVEVWAYNASAKSVEVAAAISSAISSASGLYNRGRKGNGAAWLSPNIPCAEPEIGFISNPSDNTKFDTNFEKIVNAICDTLEKHFGKGTSSEVADGVIAKGTATNYLNIRKAPINGAVLTSIPAGKVCDIYSIENGWAKVSYNGYAGYSSADYLTIEYIKKEETAAPTTPTVSKTPEILETPKKEEDKPSLETSSKGATSEDKMTAETTSKNDEVTELPPQTSSDEKIEDGLDETVPAFIKLLKKIIEIIVKIWRK